MSRILTGVNEPMQEENDEMTPSQSDTTPALPQTVIVHLDAAVAPLIPNFMAFGKEQVRVMREACAAGHFEIIRTTSHGLKGAGGSYGFDRVTELAASIEQAAQAADAAVVDRDLTLLGVYFNQVTIVYD